MFWRSSIFSPPSCLDLGVHNSDLHVLRNFHKHVIDANINIRIRRKRSLFNLKKKRGNWRAVACAEGNKRNDISLFVYLCGAFKGRRMQMKYFLVAVYCIFI